MKIEKSLHDYLRKHFGSDIETIECVKDDGKTIWLIIDFGDDEIIKCTINRRNGNNGNYRIVTMA